MQERNAPEAKTSRDNVVRIRVSPSNDRLFEFYRWANLPAFEIDAVDKTERRESSVAARVVSFADMMITQAKSSAFTYRRTKQVIANGGISDFLVEIYLNDRISSEIEGQEVESMLAMSSFLI